MMFGFTSFNLINEFERASNEPNTEQFVSNSTKLQPYTVIVGVPVSRFFLIFQIIPSHFMQT